MRLQAQWLVLQQNPEGLFFINGNAEPRSPPFESHNKDVVVTRDGPWTNVTTIYGIELNCHTNHFMCVYRLSGWYYSKTQGLLGNMDTEHYNEYMKPDGTIASTVIDFVNSYELTGLSSCQIPADFAVPEDSACVAAEKSHLKNECAALFNDDSSYLAPVFDVVDQESFFHACNENAEKCKKPMDMANPCISLARIEGVHVDIVGCA
ncbi:VWD domain-containing protein, partial [Salmonella sp. S146_54837]|uniref:VWD domain-containing protein n=1 Tax=Salmonella sp. S146_54837 TaxID=2665635 RepID=UPI00280B9764